MDRRINIEPSAWEPGKVVFNIPLNDFQTQEFAVVEETAYDLLNSLVDYFFEGHHIDSLIESKYEEGFQEGHDEGYSEGYGEGYEDAEFEFHHADTGEFD